MLYLYLDESGDLGFDFVNKKPSEHFTVCVLAIKGAENDRALSKAVRAVDKLKPRQGVSAFNAYILENLKASIDPWCRWIFFMCRHKRAPACNRGHVLVGCFQKA